MRRQTSHLGLGHLGLALAGALFSSHCVLPDYEYDEDQRDRGDKGSVGDGDGDTGGGSGGGDGDGDTGGTSGDGDGDGDGDGNTGGTSGDGDGDGDTGGGPASGGGGGSSGTGGTPAGGGGGPPVDLGCSATGWEANNGYADNGTMCGFAWASGWEGVTTDPPCGTAGPCFETQGAELCIEAEIQAAIPEENFYPGAMIGWNVAQNMGSTTNGTWTASGDGLTVTFTAEGVTGQTRVLIQSGTTHYCIDTTSGTAIAWEDFSVECWKPGGAVFAAGMPVTSVGVQVLASTAVQSVELCITSILVN